MTVKLILWKSDNSDNAVFRFCDTGRPAMTDCFYNFPWISTRRHTILRPQLLTRRRMLQHATALYKVRPHDIRCGHMVKCAAPWYKVRPRVISCGRMLDSVTCGRTLNHAAARCKVRLHVITLTKGPIPPRYLLDSKFANCRLKSVNNIVQ